ncbi:hypothetical protein [Roseivirga sp. E12]|uniref:hypothetical protein n=1 Tax=Roseivirga sp. E12 TaxID=2819237 RepID=UPI001ABD3EDA|nr:hypothetical protein [Roseivirga sp. E12]MBO3697594.1 hypothetical protein [Roseivirga sp. E12]
MSGNRLDILEERFEEGTLNEKETQELKGLLKENPSHPLGAYFLWVDRTKNDTDIKVSRQEVLQGLKTRQRHSSWRYAAILLVIVSAGYLLIPKLNTEKMELLSNKELDKTYAESLKTLSAFSTMLNEGINDIYSGADFSTPFKDFKQLNETTKQILDDENDDK